MKVSGERIVIFGDSLSHPGADKDATQSEVTDGTNRLTSAPGDMLGSIFLEQGAEAVLIDAKVGRSAYNYWAREPSAELMANLAAFAPTKVVVMLGTNDIGMGIDPETQAFTALKQAFEAMGAEVWAVGPMTYVGSRADEYNIGAAPVFDLMASIFNPRIVDARPLSVNDSRSSDGVHFTPASAIATAQNIAAALVNKNPLSRWLIGGVAVAGFIGAIAFVAHMRKRGRASILGEPESDQDIEMIAIDAIHDDNPEAAYEIIQQLSPKEKAKREREFLKNVRIDAANDATNSGHAREIAQRSPDRLTASQILERIQEELDESREAWFEQNEDAIKMETADPEKAWEAYRDAYLDSSEGEAEHAVYGDLEGRRAPWMMRTIWRYEPEKQQWTRESFSSSDRSEAEEELTKLRTENPGSMFELADDKPTKTPRGQVAPKRFAVVPWRADGLYHMNKDTAVKWFASRKVADKWVEKHGDEAHAKNLVVRELGEASLGAPTKSDVHFHELTLDKDPASMQVAEDFLLEKGWKMRGVTGAMNGRNFTIQLAPMGPSSEWKMVQTNVYEDRKGKLTVANGSVRVTHEYKHQLSPLPDVARMRAVATAWAVAKEIKSLPLDTDEATIKAIVEKVVKRGAKNMKPEELFGAAPMPGKIIELD